MSRIAVARAALECTRPYTLYLCGSVSSWQGVNWADPVHGEQRVRGWLKAQNTSHTARRARQMHGQRAYLLTGLLNNSVFAALGSLAAGAVRGQS